MATGHIVRSYDKELDRLRSAIARMGGLAEAQIAASVNALIKRNSEAARQIISTDTELDQLEAEIESESIHLLAKRQPVADDLREIVSALKLSAILERIGDYAKNIAKRVTAISELEALQSVRTISEMAQITQKMLKDALDAYIDLDAEMALDVWHRDEAVDELYNSMFRELLTYMMEDPRAITPCTHLLFVAKNIERIGDHVTNIAEIVYYLVEGEILADDRPKGDDTSFTVITPEPDGNQKG